MKLVRVAALSRRRAPPFTAVVDLEVLQLRMLSPWVRWLYLELRMLSDFKTGHLVTSWAVLQAVMDCDTSQAFAPSREQLRRAVVDLEAVRLVERFPETSTATQRLFLKVMPIKGFRSPGVQADRVADRVADTPRTPRKARNGAGSSPIGDAKPTDLATDKPTGDSGQEKHNPYPLKSARLSTTEARDLVDPKASLARTRAAIVERRGEPRKASPSRG